MKTTTTTCPKCGGKLRIMPGHEFIVYLGGLSETDLNRINPITLEEIDQIVGYYSVTVCENFHVVITDTHTEL